MKYYAQLEARLDLLSAAVDRICGDEVSGWFREYLGVGECGLAVEVAPERLAQDTPEARALAARLLPEARLMKLEQFFIEILTQAAGSEE
jgi:hypothetical protein